MISTDSARKFVIQFRDRDGFNLLHRHIKLHAPSDDGFVSVVIRNCQFEFNGSVLLHADEMFDKAMREGIFVGIEDDGRIFVADETIALFGDVGRLQVGIRIFVVITCAIVC